jgi:flagellar basal-body rod modification protein FlgD
MEVNKNLKTSISELTLPPKDKYAGSVETAEDRIKRQKSEFFHLLAVQLQNQDPLSPMDTNEMTQQIFSINQVEQTLETNKHLEDIKNNMTFNQIHSVVPYIDKKVAFTGNEVQIVKGFGAFNYEIDKEVEQVKLTITDRANNVVHEQDVEVYPGDHEFIWDTKGKYPDGVYKFKVIGYDSERNPKSFPTYGNGKVSGVVSKDGRQFLEVNNEEIPLSKVLKVITGDIGGLESSISRQLDSEINEESL